MFVAEIAAAHGEAVIAQALKMISDGTPPDDHNLASLLSPPNSTQSTTSLPSISAGSTAAAPLRGRRILSKMMEAPLNEETALGWISDSDMDICSPDFYKWTPLHKCCAWDKPAFLEALLKHPSLTVRASVCVTCVSFISVMIHRLRHPLVWMMTPRCTRLQRRALSDA